MNKSSPDALDLLRGQRVVVVGDPLLEVGKRIGILWGVILGVRFLFAVLASAAKRVHRARHDAAGERRQTGKAD